MNYIRKFFLLFLALSLLLGSFSGCQTPKPSLPDTAYTTEPAAEDSTPSTLLSDEALFAALSETMSYPDRRYYISRLSGHLLAGFTALYQGVLSFEEYIEFPVPMTKQELEAIVLYLEYDCPELMYFMTEESNYTFRWADTAETKIKGIYPPYSMTESEYYTNLTAVQAKIDMLLAETKELSPYEAERLIFDRLVSSCIYNYDAEDSNNAYGVLVNGVARCEGFSRTFTWLMHELDIPCFSLFGDSTTGDLPHSWNVVRLGDAYYEIDVTHDIVSDGGTPIPNAYSHFNVTATVHESYYSLWPACTLLSTLPDRTATADNYHVKNGRYVTSLDEAEALLTRLLSEYASQSDADFSLRFADTSDYEAFQNLLYNMVNAWCQENRIPVNYRYYQFSEANVYQFVVRYH